jgi:hypothetical protein
MRQVPEAACTQIMESGTMCRLGAFWWPATFRVRHMDESAVETGSPSRLRLDRVEFDFPQVHGVMPIAFHSAPSYASRRRHKRSEKSLFTLKCPTNRATGIRHVSEGIPAAQFCLPGLRWEMVNAGSGQILRCAESQ